MVGKGLSGAGWRPGYHSSIKPYPLHGVTQRIPVIFNAENIIKQPNTKKCNDCGYENNPIKVRTCNYCGEDFGFTKNTVKYKADNKDTLLESWIIKGIEEKRAKINNIEPLHVLGERHPHAKIITMTIYDDKGS